MKFKFKYASRIVGTFVLLGLVVFGGFIVLILYQSKTFTKKYYYTAELDNARGLQKKPPIYFRGLEIGRIENFLFNDQSNMIDVQFYVYEDFRTKMIPFSVFSKTLNPVSGEVMEIELLLPEKAKSSTAPLPQFSKIPYIDSDLGQKYVSEGKIETRSDDVGAIIKGFNQILKSLLKEGNPEDGALFHVLDNLVKFTQTANKLTEQLEKGNTVVQLNKTITGLNHLLSKIPQTVNLLNKNLIGLDSLVLNYQSPEELMRKIGAEQLKSVIESVDTTFFYIKGSMKHIYNERDALRLLIHSTQSTLNNVGKTLEALNNNPLLKNGFTDRPINQGVEIDE